MAEVDVHVEALSERYMAVVDQLGTLYTLRRNLAEKAKEIILLGVVVGISTTICGLYLWVTTNPSSAWLVVVGAMFIGAGIAANSLDNVAEHCLRQHIQPLEALRSDIAAQYRRAGGTDDYMN